jgi:NAD(P)-dependent dehydrogenase (short-subunit alcohol dehydrogenase family)
MQQPQNNMLIIGGDSDIGNALAVHYIENGRLVRNTTRRNNPDSSEDLFFNARTGEGLNEIRDVCNVPTTIVVCTGVLGPVGTIGEVEPDEWQEAIDVNLMGNVRILHALIPILDSRSRIIFFSGGGVGGSKLQPRVLSYVALKTSLIALIEAIADEPLANRPVVSAIAPGAFPTKFTKPVLDMDPSVAGPELLSDVMSSQAQSMDILKVANVIDFIESEMGMYSDGRLISAKWDSVEALKDFCLRGAPKDDLQVRAFGKLRRIDGDMVVVSK